MVCTQGHLKTLQYALTAPAVAAHCPHSIPCTHDHLPLVCRCQGPSPKELVLAALCSCTVMTIRTYAEAMAAGGKKGWHKGVLQRVHVEAEVSDCCRVVHTEMSLQSSKLPLIEH